MREKVGRGRESESSFFLSLIWALIVNAMEPKKGEGVRDGIWRVFHFLIILLVLWSPHTTVLSHSWPNSCKRAMSLGWFSPFSSAEHQTMGDPEEMPEKDWSAQLPLCYFTCSLAHDLYPLVLALCLLVTRNNAISLSQVTSCTLRTYFSWNSGFIPFWARLFVPALRITDTQL